MLKNYRRFENQRNKILIADDVLLNRKLLVQMFQQDFEMIEACNGAEAIDIISLYSQELAIVLLDIKMPEKDGFAVMEFMKQQGYMSQIPVVLITNDDEGDAMERGYFLSAADIIIKPFRSNIVIQRVHNVLELYRHKNHLEELVEEQTKALTAQYERLKEHHVHLVGVLQDVVEYRNVESLNHLDYVQGYTRIIANHFAKLYPRSKMTEKKIDYIVRAAKWHDIGKIALPDYVL